jgi:hypothetical protein
MYVKKLLKQTLENLRNSVWKLPQKEVRRGRRRKNMNMNGTSSAISTHQSLPESPPLGCIPQQTSVPVAYGINKSCQHFGHLWLLSSLKVKIYILCTIAFSFRNRKILNAYNCFTRQVKYPHWITYINEIMLHSHST